MRAIKREFFDSENSSIFNHGECCMRATKIDS